MQNQDLKTKKGWGAGHVLVNFFKYPCVENIDSVTKKICYLKNFTFVNCLKPGEKHNLGEKLKDSI